MILARQGLRTADDGVERTPDLRTVERGIDARPQRIRVDADEVVRLQLLDEPAGRPDTGPDVVTGLEARLALSA
jgi:hypothetical protein